MNAAKMRQECDFGRGICASETSGGDGQAVPRGMRRRRLIIQRARLRAASRAGSNLAYIDVRESERQGQLSLELNSCGVHCSEKSSLMTEMGHRQPRAINRRTRHFHSTSS
jgi:hypothetical protein